MRFEEKTAIITGSGTGIGRDMAIAFSREGANVTLAARRRELLEQTADLAEKESGRRPLVLVTDITREEDVERMADQTVERFGQIDYMINNAAAPGTDLHVWEQTLENWNQTLATNLTSQFLVSRACLKHMMPRRSGVILTFSSTAALGPHPRKSHYTASKLGILGFTRTLAQEVGPYGIRANCVVPGAIRTELLVNYTERIAGERGISAEDVEKEMSSRAALERVVRPEEVTQTVMFLCSDDSSAITGQAIRVCGGAAMW
jgi:NAD(P)-dependent dehydrogenase (short-subunit alcohol dehydrogenase family)